MSEYWIYLSWIGKPLITLWQQFCFCFGAFIRGTCSSYILLLLLLFLTFPLFFSITNWGWLVGKTRQDNGRMNGPEDSVCCLFVTLWAGRVKELICKGEIIKEIYPGIIGNSGTQETRNADDEDDETQLFILKLNFSSQILILKKCVENCKKHA